MPRDLRIILGGGFIVMLLFAAVFAHWLSPFDPLEQDLLIATAPPLLEPGHYLGTDSLGRDVLSRLIHACRIALTAVAPTIVPPRTPPPARIEIRPSDFFTSTAIISTPCSADFAPPDVRSVSTPAAMMWSKFSLGFFRLSNAL